MTINYNIIKYLKNNIKLVDNAFDDRDLEILVRYSFDNIQGMDVEDISKELYNINILKFAVRRRILKEPISHIINLRKFWNSSFFINN